MRSLAEPLWGECWAVVGKSVRTGLDFTLVELCTACLPLCVNVPCVYAQGHLCCNAFPHFTKLVFEAVAIMCLFQGCVQCI